MIMEQQQRLSTTRVANPLADSSSNEIDFPSESATDATSKSSGSAVGGAAISGVPNPMSGVPNPIMGASPMAMNYNNTTIAPSPIVSKKAAPTAPFSSTTPMTSLVPSPLASPSSSPPHQPHHDDDEMEIRDTSCDEPPKKEQRRRPGPNTIQWAAGAHQTDNQQESLEPVNFGDYRESPRKDSVGSWASCASHDSSSTHSPTPLSPAQHMHIEMDSGRVHHALEGVNVVAGLREKKVLEIIGRLNDTLYDDNFDMRGGNVITKSSSSGVKHSVVPKTAAPQQQQQSSSSSRGLLQNANIILATSLSRTQPSFQVVNSFFQQQLKSLILTHKQPITSASPNPAPTVASPILGPLLPSLTPFILWLTLQNDNFFRGGRGQSERLSAARIGERLLHGGLYRVTPSTTAVARHSNSGSNKAAASVQQQEQQLHHHHDNKGTVLWPLLCHEIGLSYDQEDKIRTAQRLVLQNVDLWIHRHTARATSNVIQSVHDVIGGMMELTRKNEETHNEARMKREEEGGESLLSILTEEQRMKLWGWALKNRERMKQCAERKVGKNVGEVGELEVSNERHVAANMYIIDHKLGKIKQRVPPVGGKYANPSKLKKLGRRPCFESLGGYEKDNNDAESASKMPRPDSTGSLKRSLDDMSIGGTSSSTPEMNLTSVTPEAGQAAGHAAASSLLKDVLEIIPKPSIRYHHPMKLHQQNHAQHFEPEPVMSASPAPVMSATFPSQSQQQHRKAVSSTFDDIPMPTPVSVLLQTADDFLTPSDGGVNDIMGVDPTAVIDPIPFVPDAVASSSISMISRHQSAPEFGQYLNHPSGPMGMVPVPEGDDEDDFILDDLPMDADDWLIGDDTLEF
ncbi:hypothetical protein ACHAXM_011534 [Skeletonema potamos]